MTTTNAKQAGSRAFAYQDGGLHCAEAVAKAIVELYGSGGESLIPMAATGFGGGVGKSHAELCGALAGGVIAIGCLMGRTAPGQDWDDVAELAARLREGFVARWGTTNCAVLLEQLGHQENAIECKRVTSQVAEMLGELLDQRS